MRTRGQGGWGMRQLVVGAVLSVLAVGCSPSQTTAPPPPTGTAGPSENATDPTASASFGDAVLARLRDPNLAARVTIRGTETIPSEIFLSDESGSPVPAPSLEPLVLSWEGDAYVMGSDYLLRMQVADQAGLVVEELRVGSGIRRRTWTHPWEKMPTAQDDVAPKLFSVLAGLDRLEPAGGASIADRERFRAPATTELSLVTLFMQEEAKNEPDTGIVEIEAQRDGTPVRVTVSMTSDDLDYSGVMPAGFKAAPRTYDFEFTYEIVDRVPLPELEPPTVPLAVQSRFGLTLEHPLGWTFDTTAEGYDEAVGGDAVLRVFEFPVTEKLSKLNEEELLEAFTAFVIDDLGGERRSLESTSVAGKPAFIVAIEELPGDDPFFHLEATFIGDDTMHAIAWHAFGHGSELNHRYEFERMLETVRIDE